MTTPKFTPGQGVLTARSLYISDHLADHLNKHPEPLRTLLGKHAHAASEKRHGISITYEDIKAAEAFYASAPALYAALNRLLETYAVIDEGAYCEGVEASERTPEAQELLDAQAAAYFALSLARGEKGGEVK